MISFIDGYYGWLGNQMFQFAATKALALHNATIAAFPQNTPNLHEIFRLEAIPRLKHTPPKHRYTEPHFHYNPEFWSQPDGTELQGYFQSEKYFTPYAEQIRESFRLRSPEDRRWGVKDERLREVWMWMECVSVHVRRGDYLKLKDHHPACTLDYYNAALEVFPDAYFLVFSDDVAWCRENIRAPRIYFPEGDTMQDFELMTYCDHHIIANSSFSWWSAWLGRNPKKKVIAPKQWFGPAKAGWNTKDLLPAGWETI